MKLKLLKPKSITEFEDLFSYMNLLYRTNKANYKRFTYRKFAESLNLPSVSLAAMISTGKRIPSSKILVKICEALDFSENEFHYAHTLLELHKAQDESQRRILTQRLEELRAANFVPINSSTEYKNEASWFHPVLCSMTHLSDFQEDPEWLSARLGGEVSAETVAKGLEFLVRVGMLTRESGRFILNSEVPTFSDTKSTEMLCKIAARKSSDWHFNSTAIAVDPAQVFQMKEALNKFVWQTSHKFQKPQAGEVYYLGSHLFRLTNL